MVASGHSEPALSSGESTPASGGDGKQAAGLQSMTGFARADGSFVLSGGATPDPDSNTPRWRWCWEIRSVNGKGLDVRLRWPQGCDSLEPHLRKAAARVLKRGNVSATLTLEQDAAEAAWRVDDDLLAQLIEVTLEQKARLGSTDPISIEQLLTVRGVVERQSDGATAVPSDPAERDPVLLDGFEQALTALVEARLREGTALKSILSDQLAEISRLRAEAADVAALRPDAVKARLTAKLEEVLDVSGTAVPEERLAQELALLAVKADVTEELDRLAAHIESASAMLAETGAVGRRLDFLCQEFNREANTLCSKSQDVALTGIGLAMKTEIDRFREQVQNLE